MLEPAALKREGAFARSALPALIFVIWKREACWLALTMIASTLAYNAVVVFTGVGRFPSIAFRRAVDAASRLRAAFHTWRATAPSTSSTAPE